MKQLVTLILIALAFSISAQPWNRNQNNEWDASWVCVPEAEATDAGLYLFRKTINFDAVPDKFEMRVTADNRYKLYINEKLVSLGPALGDIEHWNYETVDIAPYLKAGENIIAAEVWNEGDLKPVSQFSYKTGFLFQGIDDATKVLNSNDSWKCIEDKSYTPIRQRVRGYYAAGAGEKIDMNHAVKGWKVLDFDDSNWKSAKAVFERSTRGMGFNTRGGWTLQPSVIPQMEMTYQRLVSTRRTEGVTVPEKFPAEKVAFEVTANTTAKILLDQEVYTNAYPTLVFSGGKNSTIVLTYAEALYGEDGAKNNRNGIEGKTISGRMDTIISDGSSNQSFTSLNWRTYRYVELQVETKDSPLTIEDFYGTFTGYPFEMNAKLHSDDAELDKILDIGWRTARSCAVETYMDCPYYERLQYIGDARIQLFVSYFNSGDDRLAKNALNLMDNSRQKDGYTLSRYPDTQNQVIATYSMWYVCMLHDYLMYGSDPEFLDDKLLGSRQILNYFISFVDDDGSLKNLPGWNFTDWATNWRMGMAPTAEDGSTALLDLQLLLALQAGIDLENAEGSKEFAMMYESLANKMAATIKSKYWDASRNLFADTPDKKDFSQHTNSMAILAGLTTPEQNVKIAQQMLDDESLTQATIYFKYYLHLALAKAGMGDDFLDWLDIWRKNIELGMTTWGETSEVETTRSDCHAWGASPNIEAYRIILGIESAAPYFKKVKIEPNLGDFEIISGEMPHPAGTISVDYDNSGSGLKAEISLPDGINGTFVWEGEIHDLKSGKNTINL
ncbi:alpha-L-rhamnosidase N-terminal domain-containing protein [Maribellus mangrovi]|uniref:alpha-L-rhamnosidase-related protein n=1 Tax=Maribellus mangrovi TaxID=3133146 RepID=UPI0030ED8CA5